MKLRPLSPFFAFAFAASFASVATLAGCAADTGDVSDDPSSDDSEEVGESEDAISATPSNFGYFAVTRRDTRKCISPICGGFYVKRVNALTTQCADGSKQAECYVSAIQLTGIGLSAREEAELRDAVESGTALVKARVYKKKFNGTYYGTLKANEGWLGATGSTPSGTFYRAADNGIRCVMAPCPSTTLAQLNGNEKQNVVRVHLGGTATAADPAVLDRAVQALGTKDGVLLAGAIALPNCVPNSNCGPLAMASEFYLRVTRREGQGCGSRGMTACNAGQFCSWKASAICGATDHPGTCSYKPEICTQLFQPVCGCDGKTYSNDCKASAAGTSVARAGACVSATKN